ncbi:unnamed protein product [Pleuronectes platessa]|uniref:Uncharacterized protein n=1 Tax=Pleuronectes platessa TaxID=8262 RepID=A0A9N7UPZ2_PLEPL|nr:unnamed protein product [Pleuronectes platessa]
MSPEVMGSLCSEVITGGDCGDHHGSRGGGSDKELEMCTDVLQRTEEVKRRNLIICKIISESSPAAALNRHPPPPPAPPPAPPPPPSLSVETWCEQREAQTPSSSFLFTGKNNRYRVTLSSDSFPEGYRFSCDL